MHILRNIFIGSSILVLVLQDCFSQGGATRALNNQQQLQPTPDRTLHLLEAAKEGNLAVLTNLVRQGVPITPNSEGISALHVTSMHGYDECLSFLLSTLGSLEALESPTKNEGWTPHHIAARFGTIECLTALNWAYLRHKGPGIRSVNSGSLKKIVKSKDKMGRTPLHLAAAWGNLECIKELLVIERNLQDTDAQGMKPIDHALINNHHDCAAILRRIQGEEDFLEAARIGNLPALKKLKEEGTQIDPEDYRTGETAVHLTTLYGHVDCLQYLLNNGANKNIQKFDGIASPGQSPERSGDTALHSAARNGQLICIQRLLRAGANPNIQDSTEKQTPLYLAIEHGHVDCAEALINGKALLEVTNFGPYTPLEWAAKKVNKNRSCAMVRLLLQEGASLKNSSQILYDMVEDLIDNDEPWNQSVLECMSLLIDSGADLFERKLSPEEKPRVPFLREAVFSGALELLPQLIKNSYRFLGPSREAIEKSRTRLRVAYFGLTQQFRIFGVNNSNNYIHWIFLEDSGFVQDLVNVLIGELCDGGNLSGLPLFDNEVRTAAVDYLTKKLINESADYFERDNFWIQYDIPEERKNEIRSFLTPENIREKCSELIKEGINERIDALKMKHSDFRGRMQKRITLFVDDLVDEGVSSLHFLGLQETQKAVARYIIDNECSNPSLAALREASRNNGLATLVRGLFEVQGITVNYERLVRGCIDTRVKELQKRITPQVTHSTHVSQRQSATSSTTEVSTKRARSGDSIDES